MVRCQGREWSIEKNEEGVGGRRIGREGMIILINYPNMKRNNERGRGTVKKNMLSQM